MQVPPEFLIYINDLLETRNNPMHNFADDSNLQDHKVTLESVSQNRSTTKTSMQILSKKFSEKKEISSILY